MFRFIEYMQFETEYEIGRVVCVCACVLQLTRSLLLICTHWRPLVRRPTLQPRRAIKIKRKKIINSHAIVYIKLNRFLFFSRFLSLNLDSRLCRRFSLHGHKFDEIANEAASKFTIHMHFLFAACARKPLNCVSFVVFVVRIRSWFGFSFLRFCHRTTIARLLDPFPQHQRCLRQIEEKKNQPFALNG